MTRQYSFFLNQLEQNIETQFEMTKSYVEMVEGIFEQRDAELRSRYDAAVSAAKQEQGEDIVNYFDADFQLNALLSQIMRRNVFVGSFSFFEGTLISLCRHYDGRYSYSQKFTDYEKQLGPIGRACDYIEKIIGVPLIRGQASWDGIKGYRLLRNHLVHVGTRMPATSKAKGDKALWKLIKGASDLSYSTSHEIELRRQFCPTVIDTMWTFLGVVFEGLPKG